MPADRESLLLEKFSKVYSHLSNPSKEFGGNRKFHLDLDEALGKDAAYTTKPSLSGLLTATQVVMNTWEKEYFKQLQRAQGDTKRKSTAPSVDPNKRPRSANPHPTKKSKAGATSAARGMFRFGMQKAVGSIQRLARLWTRPSSPRVMGLNTLCNQSQPTLQLADSYKSESKYGPGNKYKSVHFSDKDSKHYRDVEVAFYLLTRCYKSHSTSLLVVTNHVYMR
jgi:hypothetical protein